MMAKLRNADSAEATANGFAHSSPHAINTVRPAIRWPYGAPADHAYTLPKPADAKTSPAADIAAMVEVILLLVGARPCPTWLVRQVERCMPKRFTGSLLVLSGCGSRARPVFHHLSGPLYFLVAPGCSDVSSAVH